jgi:hypothetical protein
MRLDRLQDWGEEFSGKAQQALGEGLLRDKGSLTPQEIVAGEHTGEFMHWGHLPPDEREHSRHHQRQGQNAVA